MTNLPTPPYTEATRSLAFEAVARAWGYPDLAEADSVADGEGTSVRETALGVLDALAAAGLLLPEGAETQFAAGVAAGRAQAAADIRPLIHDLTDRDPCSFDHHGYCQAHGWMCGGDRCPHARAKEWLAEGDQSKEQAPRTGDDRCSYCKTKDRDECPEEHV